MKKILLLLSVFCLVLAGHSFAQSESETADLFKLKCGICHTVGGGKLIGPDLSNVHKRRSEEWLLEYVRSSQAMINKGDPDAIAIFEEYNKVIMPDPLISDMEIKSILTYILDNSGGELAETSAPVSIIENATPEDFENGKALFTGKHRFANKGPSCLSCHNGISDVFFSLNSYAKELVGSFSNLGEIGVKAILENPPFPSMTQAFEGKNLKEDEIHDLLVFLKNADSKNINKAQGPSSGFLIYGLLGALGLLLIYSWIWHSRKNKSVNHEIYNRQIKSYN